MTASSPELVEAFGHAERLSRLPEMVDQLELARSLGYVIEVRGTTLRVRFQRLALGAICRLISGKATGTLAEVIALDEGKATLSVLGDASQIRVYDRVEFVSDELEFDFHDGLLGSVVDGVGRPLDKQVAVDGANRRVHGTGVSALDRPVIDQPFLTGVQAIDSFLTLGRGQRIALFGPPGCGKSILLSNIVAKCNADVVVLALVGERGREVQEFLERHMTKQVRKRAVIVVATSDRPALERCYAAHLASSIAEGYRDSGKNVLLLVDSLTRVARALREIGLAAGEPAVRRGFPASVYPALPKIIERAGRSRKGDITAIYAVLVEGDSVADPIADEIKSLTDGHIELSRDCASEGLFPAIDVVKSLSRVMPDVVSRDHMALANRGRRLLAKYEELKLLIQIGEYEKGRDRLADEAVDRIEGLKTFIHSGGRERLEPMRIVTAQMRKVVNP
ncbi:MAG: FliI/YscN family ATPase [Rhodobacter sp.]|nr:FliI/YscN family ATPase [Rhodobacter sp.]